METDVTRLLLAWSSGDRGALERLVALVYGDLRRIAARRLREERRDVTREWALARGWLFKRLGARAGGPGAT